MIWPTINVSAAQAQGVDDFENRAFVARNCRAGQNHRIVFFKRNETVFVARHFRQRGHRLALRSCHQDAQFFVGEIFDFFDVENRLRRLEITQFLRDIANVEHRTACEGNATPVKLRDIENLLHAMNVGRERRHENAARRIGENTFETGTNAGFAAGQSRTTGVCGVR